MTTNEKASTTLRIAARSDVGRSRSVNQDFAYAGPVPGAEEWELLAVADGLGGHARGEWASQRTIELLAGSLAGHLGAGDPIAAFEAAVADANQVVNFEARQQGTPGAATTLVAVLCRHERAWWVNVGDSRLYRYAAGNLEQVSRDHSWVSDQVRSGALPPDALRNHPNKNVVTRTVGFEPVVSPETGGPITLAPGDALVLCSDGLHGPVGDGDIARLVGTLNPSLAAERLVQLANDAGGPDNITVVIGRLDALASAPSQTVIVEAAKTAETEQPKRRRRWLLAGAVLAMVVASGVAAAAIWLF